ncbi:hypothetical protein YC2023_011013 [Brassica napus]
MVLIPMFLLVLFGFESLPLPAHTREGGTTTSKGRLASLLLGGPNPPTHS